MAIVYRADKGANLTAAEVDGNFHDLDDRVQNITDNPPVAVSIDYFVIEGTLLTIVMTDATTHGPFVLPVAQWRWTDQWEEGITYLVGDIFTDAGNVYFVRQQHVSVAPFDPSLFTSEGFVYQLILEKAPQPYDIGMFYADAVPSGEKIIMLHVANRSFTLPVNFANSQAFLLTATSDSPITLPIYLNNDLIGSIVFTPGEDTTTDGGQFGTLVTVDPDNGVSVAIGDRLAIALPYEEDTTAAGLAVTIATLAAAI